MILRIKHITDTTFKNMYNVTVNSPMSIILQNSVDKLSAKTVFMSKGGQQLKFQKLQKKVKDVGRWIAYAYRVVFNWVSKVIALVLHCYGL